MKKPSAARGHMTPEEITTHLDRLKTDAGKIGYLQQVLKKEDILAPETRTNVKLALAGVYEKNNPQKAADIYQSLGEEQYIEKAVRVLAQSNKVVDVEKAVDILEERGEFERAANVCSSILYDLPPDDLPAETQWRIAKRGSKLYEQAGEFGTAADLLEIATPLGRSYHIKPISDARVHEHVGELYEKAAAQEEKRELIRQGDPELMARRQQHVVEYLTDAKAHYEAAGDGMKASRLEKRLHKQEKDLSHLVGAVAIFSLCGGVLFLSPTITGNAIINQATSSASASWMGGVLVLAGIIGVIGYMKFRRH